LCHEKKEGFLNKFSLVTREFNLHYDNVRSPIVVASNPVYRNESDEREDGASLTKKTDEDSNNNSKYGGWMFVSWNKDEDQKTHLVFFNINEPKPFKTFRLDEEAAEITAICELRNSNKSSFLGNNNVGDGDSDAKGTLLAVTSVNRVFILDVENDVIIKALEDSYCDLDEGPQHLLEMENGEFLASLWTGEVHWRSSTAELLRDFSISHDEVASMLALSNNKGLLVLFNSFACLMDKHDDTLLTISHQKAMGSMVELIDGTVLFTPSRWEAQPVTERWKFSSYM